MMKKYFFMALVISFSFAQGQNFGISATGALPNNSAGLDVDFSNKGVLITRVALSSLTDATTIPLPATSLLVYSKGGAVVDGYYYNSGTPGAPIWSSFVTTATTSNSCFTNWQLFTADGTFTVPAGVTKIKVCVYGGGAGGSGGSVNYAGGGGGAGGYAEGTYTVSPLTNYSVTIGVGGIGGNAGGNNGNNGGISSFGILISATGGQASIYFDQGGRGGMGIGGYLNTSLGNGGASCLGAGGWFLAGNGTGGGGAGAIVNATAGLRGGGGGGGGFGGGNGGYENLSGDNALTNSAAGGGGGAGEGSGHNGGNGASGKVIVFW
jgi:hypothetical protein